MKRRGMVSQNGAARFLSMVLAALVLLGGTPAFAHGEADSAHFQDVPDGHWAFAYVERAYQDGAMVGIGGDPAAGTGLFAPDEYMTCGQLLTMLVNAFYPDELARTSKDGPWYAPAVRVAVDRGIVTESLDQLMRDAGKPIDRYTAAKVLVRLMDDKCVVLPDDGEREKAAASIGDWADVEAQEDNWGNKIQAYYVPSIYAMGVMSGVDEAGTFAGSGQVTRASAAVLYAKAAEKLKTSQNDPRAFQIEFVGEWDGVVPEGYKEGYEEAFHTIFPRLWARWGNANVNKHVALRMVPQEDLIIDQKKGTMALGDTSYGYDGICQRLDCSIRFSIEVINSEPWNPGLLSHEVSHVATNHYPQFKSTWWVEAIADYGYFRYCAWADSEYSMMEQYYELDEKSLHVFAYYNEKASSKMPWFLAYLDEKYPTTKTGYGLVDSLHRAMRTGQIHSDGGPDQNDADFNAVVQQITGYANIELLRQQYVKELNAGTWIFDGFSGYADNFITENLPGVPNPDYPARGDYNLCTQASVYRVSGETSEEVKSQHVIDGDYSTKWSASKEDVKSREGLNVDARHIISIELKRPVTINTYRLYHEGSQGDSRKNTVSWRLYYWDSEESKWCKLETVDNNTKDITTRTISPVKTQHIWLDIIKPNRTGDGTVRLYELELYYK